MKYQIELTQKQLLVAREALDFYCSFLLGKWEIPKIMQHQEFINNKRDNAVWDRRNMASDLLRYSKAIFIPELPGHAHYALANDKAHEDSVIAYDIYRPMMEVTADKSEHSVYNYSSGAYSKEGRIEIKIINTE